MTRPSFMPKAISLDYFKESFWSLSQSSAIILFLIKFGTAQLLHEPPTVLRILLKWKRTLFTGKTPNWSVFRTSPSVLYWFEPRLFKFLFCSTTAMMAKHANTFSRCCLIRIDLQSTFVLQFSFHYMPIIKCAQFLAQSLLAATHKV